MANALEHRHIERKQAVTARDNWPDEHTTVAIHVEHGDDPAPIVLEADGETAEYTQANDPGCIEEDMMFEPANRSDGQQANSMSV